MRTLHGLLLGTTLLIGCTDTEPIPAAPVAVRSPHADMARGQIDLSQVKFTNELTLAMVPASQRVIAFARQPDWRAAVDSLARYDEAIRGEVWHPQVMQSGAHELLKTHFSTPQLDAEQVEAAGQYADLLLRYTGFSSDALNRVVVALKPHWTPERYRIAADTLLARRGGSFRKCWNCDKTPPAVWDALAEKATGDR